MAIETFIAGPAGSYAAIGAMAVATYLCRASGVALMSRLRLTPRVTRAVKALPGSIVVATVAPLAAQAAHQRDAGGAAEIGRDRHGADRRIGAGRTGDEGLNRHLRTLRPAFRRARR